MNMILLSLVLTQYELVMDRRTDTPPMPMSSCNIAEYDKKIKEITEIKARLTVHLQISQTDTQTAIEVN